MNSIRRFSEYLRLDVFSSLLGLGLKDTVRLLVGNASRIEVRYYPRAALLLAGSVPSSLLGHLEDAVYRRRLERIEVEDPIFVLGHWRSGTTLLHHYIGLDPRFAFPNLFQVSLPRGFLLAEPVLAPLLRGGLPSTRLFDNVRVDFETPWEDETALCNGSGLSWMLTSAFPQDYEAFTKYIDLDGVEEVEVSRWEGALMTLLRKLTLLNEGRRLVLKSPAHTARIPVLLKLFPKARFVCIHRDPHEVFVSMRHMMRAFGRVMQLQACREGDIEELIIYSYRRLHDSYFRWRDSVGVGQLFGVSFEELRLDPVSTLQHIYAALSLGEFEVVEARFREQARRNTSYRRNSFSEIEEPWLSRIRSAWSNEFQVWGYDAK